MVVFEIFLRQPGEQLLAVGVLEEMDCGVGEGEAARDDEVGGGEAEERQHDEFAAPAGHGVFEHAGGAAAIGGVADDVPIDGNAREGR